MTSVRFCYSPPPLSNLICNTALKWSFCILINLCCAPAQRRAPSWAFRTQRHRGHFLCFWNLLKSQCGERAAAGVTVAPWSCGWWEHITGWVWCAVGQGYVNAGMGSLWASVGGFLAMGYAFNKYLLSFYSVWQALCWTMGVLSWCGQTQILVLWSSQPCRGKKQKDKQVN